MLLSNGGRIVALFLMCGVALSAFAQEADWKTIVFYMPDPIAEDIAQEVSDYTEKWRDPLYWETFVRDFTPARQAQMALVAAENRGRIRQAQQFLEDDIREDGTSSWYPSWIPLAGAKSDTDSLFKNILSLKGAKYPDGSRQTLEEFFEQDGFEPHGDDFISCNDERPRCRKEFYVTFREMVEYHHESLINETLPRIISFTVQVRTTETPEETERDTSTFVGELDERPIVRETETPATEFAEFDYETIRLLQPAAMDPRDYVIDTSPYWQRAAKPAASAEFSSWGRIKATLAD